MDQLKEAFQKVKEDIFSLKQEIDFLQKGLTETRERLIDICEILKDFVKKEKEQKMEK